MRREVEADLANSAYDFLRVVWPAIQHKLQGGEIKPVETTASEDFRRDLDILGGIDAWQIVTERGAMRGIASRVQWGDKSWRTFTIRAERLSGNKTELEKRLAAIDDPEGGWLLPALTVQAYLTEPPREGHLIEAGIVHTAALYRHAREHPCTKPRRNPQDGVKFDWYHWDDLRSAGIALRIVSALNPPRRPSPVAAVDRKPNAVKVPAPRSGWSP